MYTLVEQYVKSLYAPISAERLESYRPDARPYDLEMIVNYYWNVRLCEALYPALNAAEIALRNSIHSALANYFQNDCWFDDMTIVGRMQHDLVQEVRDRLRRHQRPQTPGRIVAELNFGFWVGLLNRPYEQKIWARDGFALLRTAFPHTRRKDRKRKVIYERFSAINQLRNRVFHYEPIWNRTDLEQVHAQILDAIGWISPAKRDSIKLFDRFPQVLRSSRQCIESDLKRHLGIHE